MEIKDVNEVVNTFQIPTKEISTNLASKPSKEIGEGFGNLFWLVFSPVHAARAALEPRIDGYRKRIEQEVSRIPVENLVEPPLNIVGPALEASKYYIEREELQELFSKLIASSMNSKKQESVHPSFVEVIKQLSPLDAKLLKIIIDNRLPIAKIVARKEKETSGTSYRDIFSDVMPFPEMKLGNSHLYISAIQNLSRLSLINISYTSAYTIRELYEPLNELIEEAKIEFSNDSEYPSLIGYTIEMKPGIWDFTTFGAMFIHCCVDVLVTN